MRTTVASVATGRPERATQRARAFKPGVTRVPVLVVCEDGVARVRVCRDRQLKGQYMGEDFYSETSSYLDGRVEHHAFTESRHNIRSFEMVGPAEVQVQFSRANEVVDHGRLQRACAVLTAQVTQLPEDVDPEQMATILRSYQSIQAFQAAAHARMNESDGHVELVKQVLESRMMP